MRHAADFQVWRKKYFEELAKLQLIPEDRTQPWIFEKPQEPSRIKSKGFGDKLLGFRLEGFPSEHIERIPFFRFSRNQ